MSQQAKHVIFDTQSEHNYVRKVVESNGVEDFEEYFSFMKDKLSELKNKGPIDLKEIFESTDHYCNLSEFIDEITFDNFQSIVSDFKQFILNKSKDCPIFAVADLGLWQGRCTGFKLFKSTEHSIGEVFATSNDDMEIYFENGELKATHYHHDGENHITYHLIKPSKANSKELSLITEILYRGEEHSKFNQLDTLIGKCCYKNFGKALHKHLGY